MRSGVSNQIDVTQAEFDEYVLGAMVDWSDTGHAPSNITWELVQETIAKIRAEMPKP